MIKRIDPRVQQTGTARRIGRITKTMGENKKGSASLRGAPTGAADTVPRQDICSVRYP